MPKFLLIASLLLLATGCASTPYRIVDSESRAELDVPQLADQLVEADVVFLGEEHDNDTVHRLQLELTRELGDRRPVTLSMEMFERDVQPVLDRYLAGEIDEETFLAESRPWKNYQEHYRGAIELARERGWRVLAANIPRPLASQVAKEGLDSIAGNPDAAREVLAEDGAYREHFVEAMGEHGGMVDLQKFYEAQVVKDETMAESIVDYLAGAGEPAPLIVHWCGKFHSDYDLGTVERVQRRLPEARLAVVSCLSGGVGQEVDEEARSRADTLWLVP